MAFATSLSGQVISMVPPPHAENLPMGNLKERLVGTVSWRTVSMRRTSAVECPRAKRRMSSPVTANRCGPDILKVFIASSGRNSFTSTWISGREVE